MEQPRIAVVGAGIGGLALALGLARAGLACDVYEQTRHLREIGAGLQIAPNASRLLHRLGIEPALRQVAVRPAAIELRRWDDNGLIARTPLGDACEEMYGAPHYALHRADLHSILLSRLPAGTLRLGLKCTGVEQREDEVVLRFADGSTRSADVVVGADGIHSVTRDTLVEDRPRYSGQVMYRGLIPADRLPGHSAHPRVRLWLGPGRHFVSYPVAGGRKISFAATAPRDEVPEESWNTPGRVEDLRAAYSDGWHREVVEILSAAQEVGCWALHDRDPVDSWSRGAVTLLGDAAHPMLPFRAQGANQALEDAAALVVCLTEHGGTDLAGRLRRYERIRMTRTGRIQQISRNNAKTLHLSDGAARRHRDAALADGHQLAAQDWLFGYDAAEAARAEPIR